MSMTLDFGSLLTPWKDVGTVLKGEFKRTVNSLALGLTLTLGPALSGKDYNTLMKKYDRNIKDIDRDVERALDKIPAGKVGNAMLWVAAPGPMLFKTVRDVSGNVNADSIEGFMEEYGLEDLNIAGIPMGKWTTSVAKKAARAGGFLTLNQKSAKKSDEERAEDAKGKWYTPIERLFLLQNPFKDRVTESLLRESAENEYKAFDYLFKMSGTEGKLSSKTSEYIEGRKAMADGLLDLLEQEIEDASKISSSATFKKFIDSISKSKAEKFKSINVDKIIKGMKETIDKIKDDEETLEKFLSIGKKTKADFSSEEQLFEFLSQQIYEKEFTKLRAESIESIGNAVEEIKEMIMGDLDEEDLEILKTTSAGNDLYVTLKSSLERLKQATSSIEKAKSDMKKG